MTKKELETKIKSILSKDERYKDVKVIITFKDKKENKNGSKKR